MKKHVGLMKRAAAAALAVVLACGTLPGSVWASTSKTTVDVTDDRPAYTAVNAGRVFDYHDDDVDIKLRVSGTAKLSNVEYPEGAADVFNANGFDVLISKGYGKDAEGAEVTMEVRTLGQNDDGYDAVMADASESYSEIYGVVGLAYKFYLDGHELDMSSCAIEIGAGWTDRAVEDAMSTVSEDLDDEVEMPDDLAVTMSAYAVSDGEPVLAASGSVSVPGMDMFGLDRDVTNGNNTVEFSLCQDENAAERMANEVMANGVSTDAGSGDASKNRALDGASGEDAHNGSDDEWIVVDEFGTWLVVGVGANPTYHIEYYAFLPMVDKDGKTGESTWGKSGFLNVIDTSGKCLPTNGGGTTDSPTDKPLQGLTVTEDGSAKMVDKFMKIYEDESWEYQQKPQMVYIDKVSSNRNRKTNYELASIWVLKEGHASSDVPGAGQTYSNIWDIYLLEDMARLDSQRPAEERHYDMAEKKLIETLSQVKFTSDVNNEHIDRPLWDEETQRTIYYVLIKDASQIRLVYEPVTQDTLPDDTKVDRMTTFEGTFYDYDIEGEDPDGLAELPVDRRYRTVGRKEYGSGDALNGYSINDVLNGYGINDVFANCGEDVVKNGSAIFAFGNAFGTGLWTQAFNGNELNKANMNSYGKCTFGLVTSLSKDGYVQYADGLVVPNLFNEDDRDTVGKRSYPGSSLTFKQVGDTYTLSKVKVKDDKSTQLSDLDKLHHPTCGTKPTYEHIWTNDFWPLDGVDAGDPMTGTFGNPGKVAGYSSAPDIYGKYTALDYNLSDDGKAHNNFFGMNYSVDFELTADYRGPLEYLFFGDDDMWVFLSEMEQVGTDDEGQPVFVPGEGELVCDIGGVHSSVGEYVDLWDYVKKDAAGHPLAKKYKLSFFYTERGASGSTCYMQFTLPSVSQVLDARPYELEKAAITVSKQVGTKQSDTSVDLSEQTGEKFTFTLFFQDANGNPISAPWDNNIGYVVTEAGKDPDYSKRSALQSFKYQTEGAPDKISDVYKEIAGDQVGCQVQLGQGDSVTVYNLDKGTKYYIIEERTSGYEPAVIINGSLKNDGSVVNGGSGSASWQYGDNVVQGQVTGTQMVDVTYVNQPVGSYEFPATGGGGPEIYIAMGTAVVLFAAAAWLVDKKRTRVSK